MDKKQLNLELLFLLFNNVIFKLYYIFVFN